MNLQYLVLANKKTTVYIPYILCITDIYGIYAVVFL